MALWARKVSGAFEKRFPGPGNSDSHANCIHGEYIVEPELSKCYYCGIPYICPLSISILSA